MMVFRITKARNGSYEVDGLTFPDEATAADMCIRMAQDHQAPYRIIYPL